LGVAASAVQGLGFIEQPQMIIPALTNCLRDPRPNVRRAAVWSLTRFKKADANIISYISVLRADNDVRVRRAVADAINDGN
jgi:HEAT repeat protein